MTQSRPASASVGRRYSLAVFIGRFQPVHLGHLEVISQALVVADTLLLVLGSANAARSFHYVPFTATEREQMIRLCLTAEQNARIKFLYTEDQGNMPKWTGAIGAAAREIESDNSKITLIGHAKDHSSYYLKGFPNWSSTDVDSYLGLSATTFRNDFLSVTDTIVVNTDGNQIPWFWKGPSVKGLHESTVDWLRYFSTTDDYNYLVEERRSVEATIAKYGKGPFLTGDAVVIQGDHVLMIERGNYPFKGCLAFPGGFVEEGERMVDAIFRELDEETKLKVPANQLRQSLVHTELLDAPHRDPRGRIVSLAGLIYLNPIPPASMTNPKDIANFVSLPRVRASDDAAKAHWMPISSIKRERCAFDVYQVLHTMLDFIPKEA